MIPSGMFHIFLTHRLRKAGSVGSAWGSRAVPIPSLLPCLSLRLPRAGCLGGYLTAAKMQECFRHIFTPVVILCKMYLRAEGWHAARYVSINPIRDFSVSKFLGCDRFTCILHHKRDQYLS